MAAAKTTPHQYPEKIRAFFGSESSLQEFEALSNNGDRVEFLFRHPFVEKLFKRNALDIKNEGRPHGKSICESKRQRELGNQAFKAGNDEKALRFYNEAMAYAPWRGGNEIIKSAPQGSKPSDEFAFSVANRSAALFRLGRYPETLVDVELALAAQHPKPEKLAERKVRCLIAMRAPLRDIQDVARAQNIKEETWRGWQQEFMSTSQMSEVHFSEGQATKNGRQIDNSTQRPEESPLFVVNETNPNFPAFCNSVEIVYHPQRGRFGVASRDICFGEVLLMEEPVASVLKDQELQEHCENCFRDA